MGTALLESGSIRMIGALAAIWEKYLFSNIIERWRLGQFLVVLVVESVDVGCLSEVMFVGREVECYINK